MTGLRKRHRKIIHSISLWRLYMLILYQASTYYFVWDNTSLHVEIFFDLILWLEKMKAVDGRNVSMLYPSQVETTRSDSSEDLIARYHSSWKIADLILIDECLIIDNSVNRSGWRDSWEEHAGAGLYLSCINVKWQLLNSERNIFIIYYSLLTPSVLLKTYWKI